MTNAIPVTTLNNGVEMPMLGFGVFQIPPEQTEQVVIHALEAGYRALDTAASYGNEEAVGRAIAASKIPRDELFITTKLWIQKQPGEDSPRRAFERSLERLGLDYVDLYLIHQPLGDYYSAWRVMQNVNRAGLAKAIGLSNFYPDRLIDLVERNEITPAVNQIETHPFFQRTADHELMRQHGIQHESWGPFAEGKNNLFTNPVLTEIGAAHGKSVGQVVLRWLIQRDVIIIPKSVRPERMRENMDIFDFELTDEEMTRDRKPRHRCLTLLRPSRPRNGQLAEQPRRVSRAVFEGLQINERGQRTQSICPSRGLMTTDLKARVKEALERTDIMALSTLGPDGPWTSPVQLQYNEKLELSFLSMPSDFGANMPRTHPGRAAT